MRPYTHEQQQTICDALTELVDVAGIDISLWLKTVAPIKLARRLKGVEIVWDEDNQQFVCR